MATIYSLQSRDFSTVQLNRTRYSRAVKPASNPIQTSAEPYICEYHKFFCEEWAS